MAYLLSLKVVKIVYVILYKESIEDDIVSLDQTELFVRN